MAFDILPILWEVRTGQDSTHLTYIDINIPNALWDGSGMAMLQGSVFTDDEDDANLFGIFRYPCPEEDGAKRYHVVC